MDLLFYPRSQRTRRTVRKTLPYICPKRLCSHFSWWGHTCRPILSYSPNPAVEVDEFQKVGDAGPTVRDFHAHGHTCSWSYGKKQAPPHLRRLQCILRRFWPCCPRAAVSRSDALPSKGCRLQFEKSPPSPPEPSHPEPGSAWSPASPEREAREGRDAAAVTWAPCLSLSSLSPPSLSPSLSLPPSLSPVGNRPTVPLQLHQQGRES